jgi:cytochrome c-type biogenesis protein CcmH/NrfG
MGGDAVTESMTQELVKLLGRKIDENPNNPELKKVLGEIGMWAIKALPAWPQWVYPFEKKFRP